jgi:hypothetical protein
VILHHRDCDLPASGWGTLTLAAACPRTGSAWTSTGTPYEPRGLKHCPERSVRVVPVPPPLVALLRHHLTSHGTTPDGRLSAAQEAACSAKASTPGPGTPHEPQPSDPS